MEGLVQPHGGYTTVCLESWSILEFGLAVFVDFSFMVLTFLAHICPPPSLYLDCHTSSWFLFTNLCNCFHQLPNEGSMVTVEVFTNLITVEDHLGHLIHYC